MSNRGTTAALVFGLVGSLALAAVTAAVAVAESNLRSSPPPASSPTIKKRPAKRPSELFRDPASRGVLVGAL
ncbi:hypothetical protein BASA81_003126 [Batrachochytrium salamandrivorans]|nr:hypothetical protein BASA81_003126 [Batrachochytrium salamandrivorans]